MCELLDRQHNQTYAREKEAEVHDVIVCMRVRVYFWTWRVILAGSGHRQMGLGGRVGNE